MQTLSAGRTAGNQNLRTIANQRRRRVSPIILASKHRPSVPGPGTAAMPVFEKIHEWNCCKSTAPLSPPYLELLVR